MRLDEGIVTAFVDKLADMWYQNKRSAKMQQLIDRNPELERELDNIAQSRKNAEQIVQRMQDRDSVF